MYARYDGEYGQGEKRKREGQGEAVGPGEKEVKEEPEFKRLRCTEELPPASAEPVPNVSEVLDPADRSPRTTPVSPVQVPDNGVHNSEGEASGN